MSSRDLFERVRAIPLDQVVREYYPTVELKRAGHDLVSHCPIHPENTPSFRIYTKTNRWQCFGACAKGGSTIDLVLSGDATEPLDAAKALARKFDIDLGDEKPTRKALTVRQYADFCALPESFLLEKFLLVNGDTGVEIPYRNEQGDTVSVQRRHKLEKQRRKTAALPGARATNSFPTAFGYCQRRKPAYL
jgi:hypothetical protein